MSIKNGIPPQVSLYTSKMLFDQNDDRNKKRMAQMLKRKKIILHNKKETTNDKTSPSTQDTFQNISSFLSQFKNELTKHSNKNKDSKKISHSSFYSENLEPELSSINVNIEKFSPFLSEELSPKFNESTKEINISNISDLTNENHKSPEKKINSDKILNKKFKNDTNKNLNNEFALTYLSSHLNSFISLKNKLVTKAKYENNFFTTSYSLALFNDELKKSSPKKSPIPEIILEEPESPTPKRTPSKNIFSFLNNVKATNTVGQIRNITLKQEDYSHIKCLTNINDNKGSSELLINNSKFKIPKNKLVLELKKKLVFNNKNFNNSTILNKKNAKNSKNKAINNNKVITKKKTMNNNKQNTEKFQRINKFMKINKKVYKNNLDKKNSLLNNSNKEKRYKNNITKKEISFNLTNNPITKETKNRNKISRSKSQRKISINNQHENLKHQSKCFSNLTNDSKIFEKNYKPMQKKFNSKNKFNDQEEYENNLINKNQQSMNAGKLID